MQYVQSTRLPASAADVYRWHTRPGAFERLLPPWEHVELVERDGTFEEQRVKLDVRLGPWTLSWISRHHDVEPGRAFHDSQVKGPFAAWTHSRRFEPEGPDTSQLIERIEYSLPAGLLGRVMAGRLVQRKIARMLQYRHRMLRTDLELHGLGRKARAMNIAVVGASGLVGSALVPFLTSGGHQVRRVGRASSSGTSPDVTWDYTRGMLDTTALEGLDAVVHLAGENIGTRWTAAKKRAIRSSRVDATRFLCERLAALDHPPKTLVCASAIGYYGDRGAEELTERSARGSGMLAELCEEWERAADAARQRRIRVVHVRFGIVLSPRGGPLARMLAPFRLGLGGNLGDGKQYTSWIAIDDAVGSLFHALQNEALHGAVNAASPQPLTNAEFTRTLGRVLGRPTVFPVPAIALRTLFGEMADHLLLSSTRVRPEKLSESGYEFQHPGLEGALRHLLGRTT